MSKSLENPARSAEVSDAPLIAEMFQNEYETYFGMFVDEDELGNFIGDMPSEREFIEALTQGEIPERLIEVVEDEGEFIGSGALENHGDRLELNSTMVRDDKRSHRIEGKTAYERLVDSRLQAAKEIMESDQGPKIAYTQPVSAKTAATQHIAAEKGAVPTALYDNKYFEVYPGRGRVSVVNMVFADSDFELSEQDVYLPNEIHDLVDQVESEINEKRKKEGKISRNPKTGEYDGDVEIEYEVLPEPFNIADIKLKPVEEGSSWNQVMQEIQSIENGFSSYGDDYWMKASLDASSEMAVQAAEGLGELGFDYSGLNLEAFNGVDALEMQKRPGPRKERQFIPDVMKLIDKIGIPYEEETDRTTEVSESRYINI